jgi:uncharacterized protein
MEKMRVNMRVGWLSRRTLLRSLIYTGMFSAIASGCSSADELEVVEEDIFIQELPDRLDGFKIGVLSDFHAGAYLREEEIVEAVEKVNSHQPDVVALLGDYVDGKTESHNLPDLADSRFLFNALAKLEAGQGIYAVLGNHDHWAGATWVRAELGRARARLLINEHIQLANGLVIAGVDDYWVGRARLQKTLQGAPAGAPTILLSHNPDINCKIPAQSSIKAVLSGHTHGGQIRTSFSERAFWVPCAKQYRNQSGLIRENDTRSTFVSKGIGTYLLPVRWNCPPDVGILTLRCA